MTVEPSLILAIPVFVLSIVVHECAHGLMALGCGDSTARDEGRLTLNPIPHVDPVGSLLLPGLLVLFHSPVLFGWAKPVPIDWAKLRSPRNDPVKVALAGPAANLLLALAFAGLARVAPALGTAGALGFLVPLREMGYVGVIWNCALALFNLIPIPPLDGSWVLMRFLPLRHIIALRHYRLIGFAVVMALVAAPPLSNVLVIAPLRFAVHACLDLFGLPRSGASL